jgi:hypothetical protein
MPSDCRGRALVCVHRRSCRSASISRVQFLRVSSCLGSSIRRVEPIEAVSMETQGEVDEGEDEEDTNWTGRIRPLHGKAQ